MKGYTRVNMSYIPRLIASIDGGPDTGKTTLALTAPDPLVFFNFDQGLDGIVQKIQREKEIYLPGSGEPYMAEEIIAEAETNDDDEKAERCKRIALPIWKRFYTDFLKAVKEPKVRSLVVDTGTGMYRVGRLSATGKVGRMKGAKDMFAHDALYRDLETILGLSLSSDKNVIFIHHLKEIYVDGERTGEWERSGWKGIQGQVQAELLMDIEDSKTFRVTIGKCRLALDMTMRGMTWTTQEMPIDWATIGTLILPDTNEKDWL